MVVLKPGRPPVIKRKRRKSPIKPAKRTGKIKSLGRPLGGVWGGGAVIPGDGGVTGG